jgi:hypothetical protein
VIQGRTEESRNGFSRTAKSAKAQAKAAESIGQINMFDQ